MPDATMHPVHVWEPRVARDEREDGTVLVWQTDPLPEHPPRLSDRILHWARTSSVTFNVLRLSAERLRNDYLNAEVIRLDGATLPAPE